MQYSGLRHRIHDFCGGSRLKRLLVFKALGWMFVRSWHLRRAIKHWADKVVDAPKCMLESGGGLGQWPFYLTQVNSNWNVISVDEDLETVSKCNIFFAESKINKAVFLHDNLLEYSNPGAFHLALLVDVIHCYENTQGFLDRTYDNLAPEGHVIITAFTKGREKSTVRLHNEAGKEAHFARGGFGMKEMKQALKKAGFVRIKGHYFMGKFGRWSWRLGFQFPMILSKSIFGNLFFYVLPFYYLAVLLPILGLNYLDKMNVHQKGNALLFTAEKPAESCEMSKD